LKSFIGRTSLDGAFERFERFPMHFTECAVRIHGLNTHVACAGIDVRLDRVDFAPRKCRIDEAVGTAVVEVGSVIPERSQLLR
jgi:hypothetical protein